MCKIKDELNRMTIMEWSAILVCLTAIVYPFLADSGTAFDAPVLIQFLDEDDIVGRRIEGDANYKLFFHPAER